ncbi:MAG: methionine biosynthesis protein MetW [Pseudomonadota bacterium]
MPRDTSYTAPLRSDLKLIADMVADNSRVLDVGCGDGALMHYLRQAKGADARGIEIDSVKVRQAMARGLSVVQGDANNDLFDYPTDTFDQVILSQTLQAMTSPRETLEQLVRIGRHAIVSFPNFGYWRLRFDLLVRGRMPRSQMLPNEWYDTPNIHMCTVKDFALLADELGLLIDRCLVLNGAGKMIYERPGFRANWVGEQAVFALTRRK